MSLATRLVMVPHPRILVADDDPDLLRTVAQALRRLGAVVVQAIDGAELMTKIADEGPFDLILTDVSMPWMSGLHALHSARFAGLATPVVVMTALPDARVPQAVRGLGHNARLLQKPFDVDELEAAVNDLLTTSSEVSSKTSGEDTDAAPAHSGEHDVVR